MKNRFFNVSFGDDQPTFFSSGVMLTGPEKTSDGFDMQVPKPLLIYSFSFIEIILIDSRTIRFY